MGTTLKHVLLKNLRLRGWEYGMLRALEDEIVRQTGALVVEVPDYGQNAVTGRMMHGMRWESARRLLPKKSFPVQADVIWYVLMGPENYELDLFTDWEKTARYRIAYIYDTLEPQFSLTKKLFSADSFNIRITSFDDAVPYLENLTGKKWHAIEQAVPGDLFAPVAPERKIIDFSSYGRKFPAFHDTLIQFCKSNGLYYDYTTHDVKHPTAPEEELYKQYAWHIRHSAFTVSWPVELTNPKRAGRLHPITCRWFEALACGTVIIGQPPANALFDQLLHPDLVIKIDPAARKEEIFKSLDKLWANKDRYLQAAYAISSKLGERLTWKNRVGRMLGLLQTSGNSGT
ncbi:MAG: glycosyltransferase family 1 protein [Williamsia sp.]|nr:glycosyltransferase family 1 protein [Williamsia sp.]